MTLKREVAVNRSLSMTAQLGQNYFRWWHGLVSLFLIHYLLSKLLQIIPFLHSKSFESRTAASVALSQIFSLVPVWQPASERNGFLGMSDEANSPLPPVDFPIFSVQELVAQGNLLLASSGKEFVKPAGILSSAQEVKKARKEAMSRLGLGFLDGVEDDMDLEKEFAAEMEVDVPEAAPASTIKSETTPMELCPPEPPIVKEPSPSTRSVSPALPSPSTPDVPVDLDTSQMSARERNRLKRKRKPGNSAFVAPPPQTAGSKYAAAPSGANKCVVLLSQV